MMQLIQAYLYNDRSNDVAAAMARVTVSFLHDEFLSTFYWTCSVLFVSRPRSEGWPHHGRTFSIYLYPLSFALTLPQRVMSTTWCCLSRPCVVFLACVHLALFLALFLSPGNSLVSSRCDHSMLASSLWQCLTVPSLLQLFENPLICFLCCLRNTHNLSQSFHLKGLKTCFFILPECPAFTAVRGYRPH